MSRLQRAFRTCRNAGRASLAGVRAATSSARGLVRTHITDRAHAQEALTDDQKWRRHQLRQIGVLVTLPGVLIGTGSIAAAWGSGLMSATSAPTCQPVVVTAPPSSSFDVTVLNTSGVSGAATKTASDLRRRGFRVVEASTAPADLYVRGPAKIYHGADGLDQALLAAQQVKGAELYNDGRRGTGIAFVLGAEYTGLIPLPAAEPPRPEQIKVNVYNTTWREGLAGSAAKALAARGYKIASTGNDPTRAFLPDDTAVIRFGPDGEPAAKVLKYQVTGVRLEKDDTREGAGVDLVLGNHFEDLAPLSTIPPTPPKKPAVKVTVTRPCTPSSS